MAFDGIVISNIVRDLNRMLTGGRIVKISQPEKDELILSVKNYDTYKLFISASASLPLIYLTGVSKPNPMTAPNFCMLLRKHLNSARILSVTQPGLERIIDFAIEHLDEMGDLCQKHLMVEIMGKHSNIIFCDSEGRIVDSIKHVSGAVSSVREVLPGREYFIPQTQEKLDPLTLSLADFEASVVPKPLPAAAALCQSLTGISPLIANELCHEAGIDAGQPLSSLPEEYRAHLYGTLDALLDRVRNGDFTPNIIYEDKSALSAGSRQPVEFSSVPLHCYDNFPGTAAVAFDSVSELLETYYSSKNKLTRIRQKSSDLRRVIANAVERGSKKYDLQLKQLKDTEKREKYRIYGELLTTYGYSVSPGEKSVTVLNYYT
ncbi:MAG: NFACT family protein, partial [Lachnospiraceae bacterium]|nr:NFACT family protein [Lachnospiraceae bacterium]